MTRSPWMVLGVVVGFAGFGATARAQQVVEAPGGPAVVSAPGVVIGSGVVPGPIVTNGPAGAFSSSPIAGVPIVGETVLGSYPGSVPAFAGSRSGAIMPYSYYVNFPEPSRVYVGYGANDGFPFQGQLYGHAGDRWSWSAMSTGGNSMARYYYQILR